jgi:hypothetical protein
MTCAWAMMATEFEICAKKKKEECVNLDDGWNAEQQIG